MPDLRRALPRPRPRRAPVSPALPHDHARALVARLREGPYAHPDWALFDEVRSRVGTTGAGLDVLRVADAIAVQTLGQAEEYRIHGFEVKLSRKDWQRELEQPEKCAPFRLFCAAWWLVVPCPWKAVLLSLDELPEGWGLWEVGTGDPLRIVKAPERSAEDPTPGFWRALLRVAAGSGERQRAADELPPVPIVRRLPGGRAALACGHVLERPPLHKGATLPVACAACEAGLPPERDAIVAAIEDAGEEELLAFEAALWARRRQRA